jgi:secretion/DNA translocation related TadE-like protein
LRLKASLRSNPDLRDRGSATLLAVAMMAVILAAVGGAVMVGSVVIARHTAQAAADLAALAAAGRLSAGQNTACGWAVSVADQMDARLTGCTVESLDVVVTVDVDAVLGRWGLGAARAAARAGPG